MKKIRWYCLLLAILVMIVLIPTKADASYYEVNKYRITEGENKVLSGLSENLTVNTILSNVTLTSNFYEMNVYNVKDEKITGNAKVGTGTKLKVQIPNYEYSYSTLTLILYGDTNGDGVINATDALAIIKNKTNKVKFANEYYIEAGRITDATRKNNSVPGAPDALAIIKYKLGKTKIDQNHSMLVTVKTYEELYTQLEAQNTNIKFDKQASAVETNYNKLKDVVSKYCKSDMSNITKALVLHDYLVAGSKLHYNVDYNSYSSNSDESNIANVGKTMNQLGFARCYECLLAIAGIPSKIIRDKYANDPDAAVNEVTIDGQVYYVACGADSYISQVEEKGKIRRYFFMRNSDQITEMFWEDDCYFSYTPITTVQSKSTKFFGVEWPEYRKNLDYKNSEIKLASGKTIVNNLTELTSALLAKKDYVINVTNASSESLKELDAFCKKVIAKFIKPDMSEAEKALTIHDYVCSNFTRSDHESVTSRKNLTNKEYDRAWGYYKTSLLSGLGDCISATNSFNTLCSYVGIETKSINQHQTGEAHGLGNHYWSLVKIDGKWYHCDCEGADYWQYGEVDRTWFLVSDSKLGIKVNDLLKCTSTKYDNYKWPEFKGVAYYQDKTGITEGTVPVTDFWIRERTESVVDSEFSLMIRLFPYGSNSKVTYTSSNTNVATVDANGTVKTKQTGTTTITVKVNGITKQFKLKVGEEPKYVTVEDAKLKVNQTKKLSYTVTPQNALYNILKWYSSNEKVVTVDQNGNIKAVGEGTARVYCNYSYIKDRYSIQTSSMGGNITVTK